MGLGGLQHFTDLGRLAHRVGIIFKCQHPGNDLRGQATIILKVLGEFLLLLTKEMSGSEKTHEILDPVGSWSVTAGKLGQNGLTVGDPVV